MFLKFRLKLRNFIKKHKNKILIIFVIWAVILVINFLIGHKKGEVVLNTTYTPHNVVLKSDYDVPEKLQNPIEDLFYDYMEKCNNKDYAGAFALLADDCKQQVFDDSEEKFKNYVDGIFPRKKRYSIQDYSNYGNLYIYNVKIVDDIITTGLTDQEYAYYEEKMAVKQNGDKLQLCVNDYMGYQELKKVSEDDYLKVRVEDRTQYYGQEIYTLKITNKTDKDAIIYDEIAENEVYCIVGEENRTPIKVSGVIGLKPGETGTFRIIFNKFYDEQNQTSGLIFNKIRLMNNYTGKEESEEEEINKSEKIYSLTMQF